MGESGAQRAVTPPSSGIGGSTPSASTITVERVCRAFAIFWVRAIPGDKPDEIEVIEHGTRYSRTYRLEGALLADIAACANFVRVAAAVARRASA